MHLSIIIYWLCDYKLLSSSSSLFIIYRVKWPFDPDRGKHNVYFDRLHNLQSACLRNSASLGHNLNRNISLWTHWCLSLRLWFPMLWSTIVRHGFSYRHPFRIRRIAHFFQSFLFFLLFKNSNYKNMFKLFIFFS